MTELSPGGNLKWREKKEKSLCAEAGRHKAKPGRLPGKQQNSWLVAGTPAA